MHQLFQAVADNYPVTIIAACILIGMMLKSMTMIFTTASRERSRREIAAYIAEGSLTAEQGERLIRADVNSRANRAA